MRLTSGVHRVRQPRNEYLRVEGVEALAREEVKQAARAAEKAYEEVFVPFYEKVEQEWPVKSGFSKGALQLRAKTVGPYLVMKLENIAFYAGWIRQRKERVQNLVSRLVWRPSRKLGDEMADRLRRWLAEGV